MPEINKEEWARLIEEIDAKTLSPNKRAELVFTYLRSSNFDEWDIICFCSWYLMFISPSVPFLENLGRILNIKVHQWHYQATDKLGLIKEEKCTPDQSEQSKE